MCCASDINLRPILLIIYISVKIWHKFVNVLDYQIAANFCIYHSSTAVMACAKIAANNVDETKIPTLVYLWLKSHWWDLPLSVSLIRPSCLSLSSQANTVSLQGCLSNHPGLCLHSSMDVLFWHMRRKTHKTPFHINVLLCAEATNETATAESLTNWNNPDF